MIPSFIFQSPDTSRILRENTELRREIEAMKRALDVRRHPPEAEATLNEVRDSQFDGEGESLKEKYDEARRLNDFFKDQVKTNLILNLDLINFLKWTIALKAASHKQKNSVQCSFIFGEKRYKIMITRNSNLLIRRRFHEESK